MENISIGAVGASLIAGFISLISLIISKEQKISEFRQKWIDDLRACLTSYIVNINSISDMIRLKNSGHDIDNSELIEAYKNLNDASLGIKLRINKNEYTAQELLSSMDKFEEIAQDNSELIPSNIKKCEDGFLNSSQELLKFEWNRVKKGEGLFLICKWILSVAILSIISFYTFSAFFEYFYNK